MKHTLYIIGGPARVGKTHIFANMVGRTHAINIQTDAIRAAVRKVLIAESHVTFKKLQIITKASFRRPGSLKIHTVKHVQNVENEEALVWTAVLGLIETYDRKNTVDVIVEGVAVTPERVHALKLKNMRIRAAFAGYSNESHADAILTYANKAKDWVHTSIKEHGGDTEHIRQWVKKEIAKSKEFQKSAKKFGYGYFDITTRTFKKHITAVSAYLLKK